jgi:protein phosphatase 2C family protein 2/3
MVAEAEVVCQQSVDVLDVKYFPNKGSNIHEIGDGDVISPSNFEKVRVSESVSAELLTSKEVSFFFHTPFDDFLFLSQFCVVR